MTKILDSCSPISSPLGTIVSDTTKRQRHKKTLLGGGAGWEELIWGFEVGFFSAVISLSRTCTHCHIDSSVFLEWEEAAIWGNWKREWNVSSSWNVTVSSRLEPTDPFVRTGTGWTPVRFTLSLCHVSKLRFILKPLEAPHFTFQYLHFMNTWYFILSLHYKSSAFVYVLVQSVLHVDRRLEEQSGGSAILVLERSCLQTFLTFPPKGAD